MHTVRLEELARRFPVPIQLRSRIKKLQRFLSLEQFNIKTLWFPILSNWITTECSRGEVIYAVRGHWGIENSLHWVLDVAFGEDDCSIDRDHAPENLARLRKMALNLWSSEKTAKIGVAL